MVQEEPDSSPPTPLLDLTIIEKKCHDCKEPLSLKTVQIDRIQPNVYNLVNCCIRCESCMSYSIYELPFNSEPVQECLRKAKSLCTGSFKTLKCFRCKKPHNSDISHIGPLIKIRPTLVYFKCKSCDYMSYEVLAFSSEPVQKLLNSLK